MSLFKRKPKIIKGHTFSEYLARCGQEYIMGRGEIIKDPSKLKPNRRYWEINGEYYQVSWKREQQIAFTVISSVALVTTICLPIYFCVIAPRERYHDYRFKYWNDAPALKTLKEFVKDAVTPGNINYVPKKDRIATFDMDGTLFGERSPIYIEWMMYQDYCDTHFTKEYMETTKVDVYYSDDEHAEVSLQDTYDQISRFREGEEIKELEMNEAYCGAVVFSDISIIDYMEYVESYLQKPAEKFNDLYYKDMFYKPMIEVVEYLQQNNFDVYVVSGTDRFMVRKIVNQHLNIPYNKVIGMDVSLYVDDDTGLMMRGDKLKYKNVKKVKPELIIQEIGTCPILSFGNSSGDVDMHNLALSSDYHSLAFMNVANDVEREWGYEGKELEDRIKGWADRFELFWMKEDWKTIYGDNVTIKK